MGLSRLSTGPAESLFTLETATAKRRQSMSQEVALKLFLWGKRTVLDSEKGVLNFIRISEDNEVCFSDRSNGWA
jgi:hypothetical protein